MNRIINPATYVNSTIIADLKGRADIIEEVSPNEIYFGFCSPGTADEAAATWSIMKITVVGEAPAPVVTDFKWANGTASYNLKWNDRATYSYLYKKF